MYMGHWNMVRLNIVFSLLQVFFFFFYVQVHTFVQSAFAIAVAIVGAYIDLEGLLFRILISQWTC